MCAATGFSAVEQRQSPVYKLVMLQSTVSRLLAPWSATSAHGAEAPRPAGKDYSTTVYLKSHHITRLLKNLTITDSF